MALVKLDEVKVFTDLVFFGERELILQLSAGNGNVSDSGYPL